jgi:uncharacterized protein (TIGR00297 family)
LARPEGACISPRRRREFSLYDHSRPGAAIDQALIIRGLAGALLAGIITGLAKERGALTTSGQWAAFFMGIAVTAAGWNWAFLLIAFFLSSTALTHWRAEEKLGYTLATLPQSTERTAIQVIANGGLFAAFSILWVRSGNPRWALAGAGALAAASADTWSTELGTLFGVAPRSILTWKRIARGMSGGVSWPGTLAGFAGALFIAILALTMHGIGLRFVAAIVLGGFIGCLGDSALGASVQSRRWCDSCREWTERRVHPCGYRTAHRRGFTWFSNNVVNASATLIGAVAAVAIGRLLKP